MKKPAEVNSVFFINLGRGKKWAQECFNSGIIKFGHSDIPEELCRNGDWEQVRNFYLKLGETKPVSTKFTKEIINFYESSDKDLYLTKFNKKVYWCFGDYGVKYVRKDDGNFREKKVSDKYPWSHLNFNNRVLNFEYFKNFLPLNRLTIKELTGDIKTKVLDKIFGKTGYEIFNSEIEVLYYEGPKKLISHLVTERNKTLINKAKLNFKNKYGALFCEACKLNFKDKYGEIGEDFIEAHHIKPLSQKTKPELTSIKDLMMLCSNCHRMIHRYICKNIWLTKEEFSLKIKKSKL